MDQSRNVSEASALHNVIVILITIWIGLLFYNLLAQISGLLTIRDYRPDFTGRLVYMTLKIWFPWVVLSPLVVLLARRFPVRPENWIRLLLIHMLFLLGLSLIAGSALSYHYHFREEMSEVMKTYLPWQHIGHYLFGDSLFLYNAIIYTVFVASFNIRNFYELAQAREIDSARLRAQLNEARLRALKMQVNPHFLFNTLNAINVLIMKGDDVKASEMINKLGDFFRTTLEDSDGHWVPLAKELETVEKYLAIEQVRFGDRLTLKKDFDTAALSVSIPALILQPLIENAMKHGVSEKEGDCQIHLQAHLKDDRLELTIEDNGAGCEFESDPNFSEGIGIKNVRQRLEQSYAGDFTFGLSGRPNNGVTVFLELPVSVDLP